MINVGAVNDPPAAVSDAVSTDEDTVLTVPPPGVLANDIDPDAGDTRTVVAVNGLAANVGTPITLASGALLTLNPDGSGTYDPTAVAAFQALATGQSATDTFTYTMQDAAAVLSTATVTITITGVSDGPAIDLDADDSSGATGANYQFTFTDGDPARFVADATDATITDVDSTALSTLTVTLTNLLDTDLRDARRRSHRVPELRQGLRHHDRSRRGSCSRSRPRRRSRLPISRRSCGG